MTRHGHRGDDEPPTSGGRNVETSFRGKRRSNAIHASTSHPEAKLYRKAPGMEARRAFLGHAQMENRHGLIADACLTQASGLAALAMIDRCCAAPSTSDGRRMPPIVFIQPNASSIRLRMRWLVS